MGSAESVTSETGLVFRYVISSTEMRHIERAERMVFVGRGSAGRPIVWGEIQGCGPACRADLAELLVEFAMSCEGDPEPRHWEEAIRAYTTQVSAAIASWSNEQGVAPDPQERARFALEVLLDSMQLPGGVPVGGEIAFACPVCMAADTGGALRVAGMAHQLFEALCRVSVRAAAPGWTVAAGPADHRRGQPIRLRLSPEAAE